jgi:hypothetical protein
MHWVFSYAFNNYCNLIISAGQDSAPFLREPRKGDGAEGRAQAQREDVIFWNKGKPLQDAAREGCANDAFRQSTTFA